MIYFFYILAGFVSGIFGGLGMGGGTLLIPILSIFLDFDQKLAQGINLLSFLVMAIFSIYIHYRNGYIVTKNIFWIIFFGVIFSVLGGNFDVIPSVKDFENHFWHFSLLFGSRRICKSIKKIVYKNTFL